MSDLLNTDELGDASVESLKLAMSLLLQELETRDGEEDWALWMKQANQEYTDRAGVRDAIRARVISIRQGQEYVRMRRLANGSIRMVAAQDRNKELRAQIKPNGAA